jgi:hypothetical protein
MNKYFFVISVFFLSSCVKTGSLNNPNNNPNIHYVAPVSFEDADLNKDNVLDKKEASVLLKGQSNADTESPFWAFSVLVGLILFMCALPLVSLKVSKALRDKKKA